MHTELIRIDRDGFLPEELAGTAEILRNGGIVAFPTETVYGIGATAHEPEAVHRLCTLKERDREKPFSLHIAEREEIRKHVDEVPPLAAALMDLYWPGPLTIVFPGNAGKGVGIRLPSHPIARELVRQTGAPLLAPSANRKGQPPAINAEQVYAAFAGEIEAVVDGGEVEIRQASTVVRVFGDSLEVLREGLITEREIRRALGVRRIVFVCTGNSCRSPMAEGLFKTMLAERLGLEAGELVKHGYWISSAGTAAFSGGRASRYAIEVMHERGFDISDHRSRRLTRELAEEVDLIIALSPGHRWQIIEWEPEFEGKVELLAPEGVPDPIGGSRETYEECARRIERELRARWLDRIQERCRG